jgi:hypothetical protein
MERQEPHREAIAMAMATTTPKRLEQSAEVEKSKTPLALMADDRSAHLQTELLRTGVGVDHTIVTATRQDSNATRPLPLIEVTLPASHLGHFVDLLGDRAAEVKVRLLLDPAEARLLDAMTVAPDLWTWATQQRRRRRHDLVPTL